MSQKVLHLVSSFSVSGVNSNLKLMARLLNDRGWRPKLYHYGCSPGQPRQFIEDGLPVTRIPVIPSWLNALRTQWVISFVKLVLHRYQPKLVHAHSFDADLVALRACAGTRIPVVITCQSYSYLDWARRYSTHYQRWKGQLGLMVSVTRSMADAIRKLPAFADVPHEVIHNVPAERYFSRPEAKAREACRKALGLDPEDVLITCTATFHPIKGHRVLADAFSVIAARNRHAKLILIGDTCGQAEYENIRQQVDDRLRAEKADGRFRIIQGCRDAQAILQATDVYVQPSFMEALSVATAEAMAMGIPVVASGVGGLKEMVSEGESGFLVEPGASGEFAQALLRLVEDPGLRRQMGIQAHAIAETRFRPDVAAEKYAAVYATALGH